MILLYRYQIQCIYIFLNKVGLCAQKYHKYDGNVINILFYDHYLISYYCTRDQQSMLTRFNNKTVFILHASFLIQVWTHIRQISKYLQSGTKFEHSISNNTWPHIFRSEAGLYFTFFLVMYLDYILSLILCGNFPLTSNIGRCWNPL